MSGLAQPRTHKHKHTHKHTHTHTSIFPSLAHISIRLVFVAFFSNNMKEKTFNKLHIDFQFNYALAVFV